MRICNIFHNKLSFPYTKIVLVYYNLISAYYLCVNMLIIYVL